MLFPLNYHREIESDIGGNGESEKLKTPEQIQSEVRESNLDDQPVYQGPQTQCHTKALMKVNLIMNECFQVDNTFEPAPETESMSALMGQFLFLEASCIYNFVCDLINSQIFEETSLLEGEGENEVLFSVVEPKSRVSYHEEVICTC